VMIAVLTGPIVAQALDVVELKSGQRVEGSFKSADDGAVRIEVGGRIAAFNPREVHAIYYDVHVAPKAPLSPAQEALKVLRDLQSFTTAKPSFSEYRGRLGYARFRLDRLSGRLAAPALSVATASLHFFELASDAWTAMLRPPVKDRADEVRAIIRKATAGCAPLERLLSGPAEEVVDRVLPLSWSCASERIAALEQLVEQG